MNAHARLNEKKARGIGKVVHTIHADYPMCIRSHPKCNLKAERAKFAGCCCGIADRAFAGSSEWGLRDRCARSLNQSVAASFDQVMKYELTVRTKSTICLLILMKKSLRNGLFLLSNGIYII